MTECERELFDAFLADAWRRRCEVVDQACALALLGGEHGVTVRTWSEGLTLHTEARVDPAVPFGEVHEHHTPPPVRP